jgi:hypothetical protein
MKCWTYDGNPRQADCIEYGREREDAALLMFFGAIEPEHEWLLINTPEEGKLLFPLVGEDGVIKLVGDSDASKTMVR